MSQHPPYTQLDQNQILQRVFDEANDQLRVDATVTASIGELVISATDSNIAIKDPISGNIVKVNADGSIDSNVIVDAAGGDNILVLGTEDGTTSGTKHVMSVSPQGYQQSLSMNSLVPFRYNSVYPSYPTTSSEVYQYKQDATLVCTVTVTYTDDTKVEIVSIIRT